MKSKMSPLPRNQRTNQQPNKNNPPKPKRQFFVQQHRKEIDDYMLGQIKKNKKSIKHIKKQIDDLRTQMTQLKTHNKNQRSQYDILCMKVSQLKREKSQPKLDATTKRQFHKKDNGCLHKTRRQFLGSKQSSQTSRRSSRIVEGVRSKCLSSNNKSIINTNSCGKDEHSSKGLLKRKIQNLKEKAYVIRQSAQEIQNQISRKMEKKIEQSHQQNSASRHSSAHQRYEELMELLKTNKTIEAPHIPYQSQPITDNHSEKSILSTNKEANHLKNSAISYYTVQPKQTPKETPRQLTSSSHLPSETNLLESNKNISKQTPKLQFSQCLNIQVVGDPKQQQFEQILREGVSGGELSFDNQQAKEKQLKQLQFQFDQLVRQQLLSNDTQEKQMLGKNIRNLLTKIGQLRQELNQSH